MIKCHALKDSDLARRKMFAYFILTKHGWLRWTRWTQPSLMKPPSPWMGWWTLRMTEATAAGTLPAAQINCHPALKRINGGTLGSSGRQMGSRSTPTIRCWSLWMDTDSIEWAHRYPDLNPLDFFLNPISHRGGYYDHGLFLPRITKILHRK